MTGLKLYKGESPDRHANATHTNVKAPEKMIKMGESNCHRSAGCSNGRWAEPARLSLPHPVAAHVALISLLR